MRRVVALSGKRFAGKDTLAGEVVARARARGVTVGVHAFAAESKRMFVGVAGGARGDGGAGAAARRAGVQGAWRPQLTAFTVAALREDPLVFCRAVADRIAAARRSRSSAICGCGSRWRTCGRGSRCVWSG
jgi:hypothetical protein